jgi:hypothetical protein
MRQAEDGSERQGRRDRQAASTLSLNHTVRLLRWRRAASYADQFVIFAFAWGYGGGGPGSA